MIALGWCPHQSNVVGEDTNHGQKRINKTAKRESEKSVKSAANKI